MISVSGCRMFAVLWTVVALLATSSAFAQDPAPSGPGETVIEEIVVVGSLIKRRVVYEGRAPVQTLDAELFESTGASQAVDILGSLTANTGSYIATQQNYLQGVAQFSLRGVGLSSTLTLINGRRAGFAPVSNDVGQSFFDINSLPVLLIERVEILRDGASATYGSQAVAGEPTSLPARASPGWRSPAVIDPPATRRTTWLSLRVLRRHEAMSAFTEPGSGRTRTFAPSSTG